MKLSRRARSSAVFLAAVTAATTGLSGCGGSAGNAAPAARQHSADPASSGAVSSPTPTPSPSPTPSSPTTPGAAAHLSKVDFVSRVLASMRSRQSMHMTMSMGDTFHEQADMSYAGSGLEMQATMHVSGHREDVRFVHGTMYLAMPGTTPPGKFLRVGRDNPMLGQLIGQLEAMRPQDFVKTLQQGIRSVDDLGSTSIGGTPVTHYRVTVAATPKQRALARSLGAGASVPKAVEEDIYVGRDDLIRRSVVDVSGQRMVIDYTRWGEPVHISAPPASRVIEMPTGNSSGGSSTH